MAQKKQNGMHPDRIQVALRKDDWKSVDKVSDRLQISRSRVVARIVEDWNRNGAAMDLRVGAVQ